MSSTDSTDPPQPPAAAEEAAAAAAAAASQASPHPAAADSGAMQGTPVLNTLLSSNSQSGSNPPSNAAPQFASPQQSPVPRGPSSRPESRDKYAATANAVAAGAGAPPRHPGVMGVQAQEWAQPRSPASPAGPSGYPAAPGVPDPSNPAAMQGMPPQQQQPPPGAMPPGYPPGYASAPHGYWPGQPRPGMPPGPPHGAYGMPPGYPPHYMQHPGAPHPGYGYPGGPPPHPGMSAGMRPPHMQPGPQDMVRMPPGPNPMEWAAMQRQRETNADGAPVPSPAGPPMPEDDRYRAGGPPPQAMVPQQPLQQAAPSAPPAARREISIVDRLVGPATPANPIEVMPARRAFFDKLVAFCERHGEPITMIPQVSKQNVDLHRLYIAVRNKGGFEQVTKDKAWKMICCEANPDISESSAAGYQLRRHYQKHLLLLECMETGRNPEDAVAFADKLKKKKKDPSAGATPGGTGASASSSGTPIPSTSGTPLPQQQPAYPQEAAKTATATATWYPQQVQHVQQQQPPYPRPTPPAPTVTPQAAPPPAYDPSLQQQQHQQQQQAYPAYPSTHPQGSYPPPAYQQYGMQQPPMYAQYYGGGGYGSPAAGQGMAPGPSSAAAPSTVPAAPSPYAQYAMSMYQQHAYYRSRGMAPPPGYPQAYPGYPPGAQQYPPQHGYATTPGAAGTPTGPGSGPGSAGAPSPFPGGPPPPGYYGGPPGAPPPGAWPPPAGAPGGYPGYPQPGPMRPHPGMPDPSAMSEEQRAAYMRQQQQQAGVTPTDAAPVTPYSQPPVTPAAAAAAAAGDSSRAPSAPPPATPDSSSRLSAPDTASDRPASQASNAAAAAAAPAATPTPGPAATPAATSAPSTSMAATPHYGQPPPMYAGGGPPGGAMTPGGGQRPPPQMAGTPYPGYPPAGAYGAPPHGYPPHMAPHPSQYAQHMQQQQQAAAAQQHHQQQQHAMWAAQQQQAAAAAAAAAAGRGGYPGAPQQQMPGGVPPPGTPARGPYGYPPQQPQPLQQTPQQQQGRGLSTPTPAQPAPSPGGSTAQRMRGYQQPAAPAGSYPPTTAAAAAVAATPLRAPPPMAAGAAHAGTVQPPGPAGLMMSGAFPQQSTLFPPGSVEASSISQRRRRKMLARDLIGATPRRLLMTLRSALDTEVVWAVNALTVILHDDSFTAPSLAAMPGILSAVVDHLAATLHVLWPDEFELPVPCVASSSKAEEGPDTEKMVKKALKGSAESVKGVVGVRDKKGDKRDNGNYTKITRTGRKVHFKEAEMPEELRRRLLDEMRDEDCRPSSSSSCSLPSSSTGLPTDDLTASGSLVNRAVARLKANLEAAHALNHPRFRLYESCVESTSEVKEEVKDEDDEEEDEDTISPFFFRLPNKIECAEYPNDVELETFRPTALINRDSVLVSLTHRALALSNIVRGLSFCHGNEQALAAHPDLMRILGKFLKLCVRERLVKKVKPPKPDDSTPCSSQALVAPPSLLDAPDSAAALLQDVAVQLREDAFTVLAHLSVVLDLYDMDSSVSYPIMDGLVHWAVSATAEATDNLLHGIISPRDYALEALCKLCVLERNVDLLLSTGPWPRMERLVKVLSRLLPMHEDSHHREFAIVILNAMCLGSEAVCWTTAVETNAIHHLLNFIEISDHNMHTVMQSHGMSALRDNPEMMGTSVGMLRRAASIIKMLTKVSDAYKTYSKYQSKLIQFTMSQLMDSRVAGMIAESLYEIQQAEGGQEEKREEEEKEERKRRDERREEEKRTEKEEEGREEKEKKVANGHSPTSSEGDSATQDSTASTTKGKKGMNGVKNEEAKKEEVEEDEESEDSQPARGRKRGGSQQENGRDAKRCKGGSTENGFPSPDGSSIKRGGSNGEISAASAAKKSLKMKESSRAENGSAMTAVA